MSCWRQMRDVAGEAWREVSAHEEQVQREIRSWLADDQQLAELGRRCVAAMLGRQALLVARQGPTDAFFLRRLLADDWLHEI